MNNRRQKERHTESGDQEPRQRVGTRSCGYQWVLSFRGGSRARLQRACAREFQTWVWGWWGASEGSDIRDLWLRKISWPTQWVGLKARDQRRNVGLFQLWPLSFAHLQGHLVLTGPPVSALWAFHYITSSLGFAYKIQITSFFFWDPKFFILAKFRENSFLQEVKSIIWKCWRLPWHGNPLEDLRKTQISGLQPQSFWLNRSGVQEAWKSSFLQAPRCCCCRHPGTTLSSRDKPPGASSPSSSLLCDLEVVEGWPDGPGWCKWRYFPKGASEIKIRRRVLCPGPQRACALSFGLLGAESSQP